MAAAGRPTLLSGRFPQMGTPAAWGSEGVDGGAQYA